MPRRGLSDMVRIAQRSPQAFAMYVQVYPVFIYVSFRDPLVILCPSIRLDVSAARTITLLPSVSVSKSVSGPFAQVLGRLSVRRIRKQAMWRPARPWLCFGLGSYESTIHLDGDSALLRVQYGNPTAQLLLPLWLTLGGNEVPSRCNDGHLTYACPGLNINLLRTARDHAQAPLDLSSCSGRVSLG